MMKYVTSAAALLAGAMVGLAPEAEAGPEPYIGEIMVLPYNFCPRGTMAAHGQLLPIAQNSALFSLLGTMYGGDGRTTFALPDLRGRVPVGQGQGPGLNMYQLGQRGGAENTTLTIAQMPSHTHNGGLTATTMQASDGQLKEMSQNRPQAIYRPALKTGNPNAPVTQWPMELGHTGASQPISVVQPYLTLNYCIAVQGIYPSRS